MRKILLLTIIILCTQTVVRAQYVWASQDNNSHYVEIECSAKADGSISLNRQQKPALEYIGVLLNMHRDKIKSGEWSIWVESYIKGEGASASQNRVKAKMLSNTIKSYLISNCKVVESDFTTRNYSGTLSKKQYLTTVVVGMRYPLEKILTEQLVDWEYEDVVRLTDLAKTDSSIVVNYGDLTTLIPGVDTSKIYSPHFEPVTFSYKAPAPELMKIRGAKAISVAGSDSIYRNELKEASSLFPDSLRTIQKALQDSLNSPTYILPAPEKIDRRYLRQEKLQANKEKKQRRSSKTKYGDVEVYLPSLAVGATGVTGSKSINTIDAVGSSLSISDHERVVAAQIEARNAPNKEWPTKKEKESTNTLGNAYIPYPNIAGFTPGLSNGVDIKHVEAELGQQVTTKKVRVRSKRAQKIDLSPKVVVDDQGRISIDATGIERSLNVENSIRMENENRTMRAVEQRLFREQIVDQKLAQYKAIQQAKGRFAVFGVGINALTSAALIPSVQLDAYFSDRFSAIVEGFYSKWNYDENYKFNIAMISPELRFFPMGERKAFNGLYIGIYGSYGHYNTRWNSRIGYQNDFLSAGLSLGYVLPLGKSGFHLEAGLSAGYLNQWGDKYIYHYGDNYKQESYSNTKYFYPTKIKVSFIYRIFNQKKIIEREND